MEEVSTWCKGKIIDKNDGAPYIKVEVFKPLNERQTEAYVGDWVLFAGTSYKVYHARAFENSFEPVHEDELLHRSAKTGQFVSEAEAQAHPNTTVTENG